MEMKPAPCETVRRRESRPLPKGVLFLCVHNSCRSQMAEGFARVLAPPDTTIYSAGAEPGGLDPLAVKAMAEVNVDITRQFSKGLDEVPLRRVDLVVTLCGEGAESCPALPGDVRRLHWPIEDPSKVQGGEEERLRAYRRARSRILRLVSELFG